MHKNLRSVFLTLASGLAFSAASAQTISITASTADTICSGTMVTFAATATGGTHYQWLKNSIHVGVDSNHYSTAALANGDVIQCELLNAPSGSIIALSAPRVMTVQSVPTVAAISGSTTVCRLATTTLTDATAGGAWNSTNPFIASVGSGGLVTGINTGVDTISYTITNMCGTATAIMSMTVVTTPAVAPITGPGTVCMGGTGTFIDSPSTGVWSVSTTSVGTISGTGVLTPVAIGIDTVLFTVTNGCGSTVRRRPVAIATVPVVTPITGTNIVCQGDTVRLHDLAPGGNWRSTNNGVAAVVPGGGGPGGGSTAVIRGNAGGSVSIVYVIANACGADSASYSVTVNPLPVVYPIIGKDSVCPGDTTSLFEYTTGGVWTSQNALATVDASGNVIGITAGIDTIFYSVTNSCGTVKQAIAMHIYCPKFVGVPSVPSTNPVAIFPNPAHTEISVSGVMPASVQVINTMGQTVRSASNSSIVSVADLPSGIYFVSILDQKGNTIARERLVKW